MAEIFSFLMTDKETIQDKINIDSLLDTENPDDTCSKQNIEIQNSTIFIPPTDTGDVDDEYNPGF